jgi:hypothetical protein
VALPLSYRRTEKPASGGGPAPMTVCADDLAFRHPVEDSLQWSVEKPAGDAAELVAEMVELENQHVGFAAVAASASEKSACNSSSTICVRTRVSEPGLAVSSLACDGQDHGVVLLERAAELLFDQGPHVSQK